MTNLVDVGSTTNFAVFTFESSIMSKRYKEGLLPFHRFHDFPFTTCTVLNEYKTP